MLIANPNATTSGGWTKDVIIRSLRAEFDLTLVHTQHRMHAAELAHRARIEGFDAVITLGGDGTINETINGLLQSDDGDLPIPTLACIPGGLANVFPRSLGFSQDAMAAAGEVIESLIENHTRMISLGKANDRWFAFNAGVGFDAGIISAMESQRAEGAKASPARYVVTGLKHYLEEVDWRTAHLSITLDDGRVLDNVFMVIVQNTAPYSYIGPLPLDFSMTASFEGGLDVIALTDLSPLSVATYLAEAAAGVPTHKRNNVVWQRNLLNFTVRATEPTAVQVDGDGLGNFSHIQFSAHPNAVRVVVPHSE